MSHVHCELSWVCVDDCPWQRDVVSAVAAVVAWSQLCVWQVQCACRVLCWRYRLVHLHVTAGGWVSSAWHVTGLVDGTPGRDVYQWYSLGGTGSGGWFLARLVADKCRWHNEVILHLYKPDLHLILLSKQPARQVININNNMFADLHPQKKCEVLQAQYVYIVILY